MNRVHLLNEFAPSGFFVLRTPLLPFDDVLKWGEGLESPESLDDPARLERALADDRALLRSRLTELIARPEVREAIFLASPDLDESIERGQRDPEGRRGQRIERALVRYFARMAGRATPFGLFAGWSVGTLDAGTHLAVEARADYRRHTRLDMDYLYALAAAIEQDPVLRGEIVHRPNHSLYRAAGRVRYIESRQAELHRIYHLVAVESTDYLDAALDAAEGGGFPRDLAARLVKADASFDRQEAEEFIDDLIENQLLLSDLSPAVTGPEPIPILIAQLREHAETTHIAERLGRVHEMLEALDAAGLGNSPRQYHAVADSLRALPVAVNPSKLFQADMLKPAPHATLGRLPLEEIAKGVEILQRLTTPGEQDPLQRFRHAFTERYGEGREVSLVEALDDDIGVGFRLPGETHDGDAALPEDDDAPRGFEEAASVRKRRETHLLHLYEEARARGAGEVVLEAHDLAELAYAAGPPLPDAFEVLATMAAASEADIEQGRFRVFVGNVTGPSGVRSLGRFCHADENLARHVRQHLRAEASLNPEAVFAEVVHLPGGRTGNVLLRPVLREYEIPYLGRSGAPAERQIPVTDLLVSVRGKRVSLRSRRLRREVIPRLTAAHNFKVRGLSVYQFLGLVQGQGRARKMHWSWGHLDAAMFLPRVSTGRVVLSKARWLVGKKELAAFCAGRGGAEQFRAVQDWRAARRLPRFVALADNDNELIIDLDNSLGVETFIELVKRRDEAILIEMFPTPDELCVQGPEGRFVHEIIVPFVRVGGEQRHAPRPHLESAAPRPRAERAETRAHVVRDEPRRRTFPPGSEWLYFKLYTGVSTADYVLRDVVRPVADEMMRTARAESWFFIRYADPDWHIRLRLRGRPETLQAEVLPAFSAAAARLLADGRLWRIQIDTYEREVERYGGADAVELAEQLFHADSEAVLSIVEAFTGNEGAPARRLLALRGLDMLFEDFGLDVAAKRAATRKVLEMYGAATLSDINLKRRLGERYRSERSDVESILDAARDESSALAAGLSALRRRSTRLTPIVAGLKTLEQDGRLTVTLFELLAGFAHMHVNRILRPAQRGEELTLYDFLARFYESREARRKKV